MNTNRRVVVPPAGDNFKEYHDTLKGELLNGGRFGIHVEGDHMVTGEQVYRACKKVESHTDNGKGVMECKFYTSGNNPIIMEAIVDTEEFENIASDSKSVARYTQKSPEENLLFTDTQFYIILGFLLGLISVALVLLYLNKFHKKKKKVKVKVIHNQSKTQVLKVPVKPE